MERIEEIIEFWFGDTRRDASCTPEWMGFWFGSGSDLDQPIRERFGADVRDAMAGRKDHWTDTAAGQLALILLLDQFTRNIYRGTADAFAHDDKVLALTQSGIADGIDGQLGPVETAFFYMPMQHAENLAVQMQSVAMYEALAESLPETAKGVFQKSFTNYARQHLEIIMRFGRFPHRNNILGRESTPDEKDYLASDAPTFGQ